MPIYEYRCTSCDGRFERYVRAFGEAVQCPSCQSASVERLLSTFALASPAGAVPAAGSGGCCGGGCGCAH
jgi:putative FmdB family regulatory protein